MISALFVMESFELDEVEQIGALMATQIPPLEHRRRTDGSLSK